MEQQFNTLPFSGISLLREAITEYFRDEANRAEFAREYEERFGEPAPNLDPSAWYPKEVSA